MTTPVPVPPSSITSSLGSGKMDAEHGNVNSFTVDSQLEEEEIEEEEEKEAIVLPPSSSMTSSLGSGKMDAQHGNVSSFSVDSQLEEEEPIVLDSGSDAWPDDEDKKDAAAMCEELEQLDDVIKKQQQEEAVNSSKTEEKDLVQQQEEAEKKDIPASSTTRHPPATAETTTTTTTTTDTAARNDNTLSWENLTVYIPGGGWKHCNCLDSPLKFYAQEYMGLSVEEREPFYALDGVSGVVLPGEMVLVLSSNNQYSSTLIRALTGRLASNKMNEMHGTILLNGIPLGGSKFLQSWRRIAPYVSASDDSHAAVLTVKETLHFACQCTSDGTVSDQDLAKRAQRLMEVLDLHHVADTVVGDENLRGISGGQKRRVTVGEMMTDNHSSFLGLENITDGLSSTDSFSLIQNLSRACRMTKKSAVVSLLQPSDDILNMFDKVLVLTSQGELAYFGPVQRALLKHVFLGDDDDDDEHHHNLGDDDPAESPLSTTTTTTTTTLLDTGSMCDLVLKHSGNVEREAAAMLRFTSHPIHQDMVQSISQIRANAPPARDRDIRVYLPKTEYSSSTWYQVKTIGARRMKLIARNAVTWTRIAIAILFGLIIGSLFSQLNNDVIGSLSRTGYMFLHCFLVLMLSAAITIPQTFRDRVTLFKHRSAEFYSGRVAYLTQVLLDVPLSILEAVILASISYYWVGMQSEGNHFFFFLGTLIGLEFVGQAFGRLLCAVSRKQVYANSLSSVCILIFGTVAAFMPSYDTIPGVLRWLSWVTPASYAFEGLMINEFSGRQINGLVIAGEDGDVELGTVTGETWIGGFGLPRAEWGSPTSIKTFDVFFLFMASIFVDMLGFYFVEKTKDWFYIQSRRPQRKAKSLDFVEQTFKSNDVGDSATTTKSIATSDALSSWPHSLVAKGLSYYVPIKSKTAPKQRFSIYSLLGPCLVKFAGKSQKVDESFSSAAENQNELELLQSVDVRFRRGRIAALMGTSGAGKTTLLDVIAGYKTGGRIEGSILLDGQPKQDDVWKLISGYAEQNDILNPYMSTLETLRFTAACRLLSSVDKAKVIDDVVRLMRLEDWTDVVVGREREDEGLPKHARKRLTIAVQLVTLPRILFADEPTTGLGTSDADLVMDAIRRCTNEMGLITVTTIHQPSKLIWDRVDDLALLVKGGKLVYMGEIGENSKTVLSHFATLSGRTPPDQVNPADFVLSAVASVSIDDAVGAFHESLMKKALGEWIESEESMDPQISASIIQQLREEQAKGKSFFSEFLLLTQRHFLTQWRNPSYCFMRLMASSLVSIYMGILFIADKTPITGAVQSIGALFFLVFILVIPMQATVVPLIEDRAVLYRESVSGLYSRIAYGLGQLAADIPFHMINTLVMFVCFYFIVGFRREADLMGYFILILFMANWVVMSLGQLYALATPNEESANGLAGLSVILSVILMGFLITVTSMPDGWVWAYWANLFHYIIQGLTTNELAGNDYTLDIADVLGMDTLNTNNITNAFLFEPGTDFSPSSPAMQTSAFISLAMKAGPGINELGESGIDNLTNLIQCFVENDCLEEPVSANILSCIVGLPPPFPPAICKDEFDAAIGTVVEVASCFNATDGGEFAFENSENEFSARGVPQNFTTDILDNLTPAEKVQLVLCLMKVLLPPERIDKITEILLEIVEKLYGILVFIAELLDDGIQIPGELILFVFGWAELEGGQFDAPYKWHYCMTAIASFLLGIEIMKLFAVRNVVWTKR